MLFALGDGSRKGGYRRTTLGGGGGGGLIQGIEERG